MQDVRAAQEIISLGMSAGLALTGTIAAEQPWRLVRDYARDAATYRADGHAAGTLRISIIRSPLAGLRGLPMTYCLI